MGIFSSVEVEELENQLDNQKAGHRLEVGRLKKELGRKQGEIHELEAEIGTYESQIRAAEDKINYYEGLERDEAYIIAEKKRLSNAKDLLAEDEKLLRSREERLTNKRIELEEEENYQFKRGYSDGLADGLRKAHEITAEDRKMLATIALATNQSEAIKEAKLISKQLEAPSEDGKKSKS
jgi:hypothetical protein